MATINHASYVPIYTKAATNVWPSTTQPAVRTRIPSIAFARSEVEQSMRRSVFETQENDMMMSPRKSVKYV